MRALLAAVGTRGDVQPALALALEIRKLGHAVRLCISPNFVDWARGLGLDAVPMGVEMRMPGRKSGAMPTLTPDELRRLRESMPDLITDQFETIGAAVDGCDVIVGANAHQYAAPSIADQFYWASRIVDLGIGATIPHRTMTDASLTGALRDVFDSAVVARARSLASEVRWDGAEIAARRLEAEYGGGRRS